MTRRLILGIETSCDETAAAVVADDMTVLSNVISSQMEIHARYGGVVPEIASRVHVSEVIPVIVTAMDKAGASSRDLAAIAVTGGPGLMGSLLVGVAAAKGLALAWKKPVLAVNHLEGHLASATMLANAIKYPCLVLLVSGGHTLLAKLSAPGHYTVLGSTRDDSAGEAYDKVAQLLGLGYPGGPVIDRMAADGVDELKFPRPMIGQGLDFSFSGLKTAVRNYVRTHAEYDRKHVATSFAAAVIDVLLAKIGLALRQGDFRSVAVVGGVSASPLLRKRLDEIRERHAIDVILPALSMTTDNAAMIAAAAWPQFLERGADALDFSAEPRWRLRDSD
jgi:N6-L-threonylcarbamoyladenine synthase